MDAVLDESVEKGIDRRGRVGQASRSERVQVFAFPGPKCA
jgi:hypothetical protein